jgi:hypothetical protein
MLVSFKKPTAPGRLGGPGTHHYSSSEIQPAEQNSSENPLEMGGEGGATRRLGGSRGIEGATWGLGGGGGGGEGRRGGVKASAADGGWVPGGLSRPGPAP